MAKQVINIGTTANDGTGDPLRSAFDKVNDNFTELYTDDTGDVDSIIAGQDKRQLHRVVHRRRGRR